METVTLEGRFVRLEPLSLLHLAPLCTIGLNEEIWRWTPAQVLDEGGMKQYIEAALKEHHDGKSIPFATIERSSGKVVGSTRFGNIDLHNRRAEIGWTWIAPEWQRTAINTEAKLLMLGYAFETRGLLRVEFKTDALNEKSRNALLRIGAKEEGILRSHMATWSSRRRDTVYYSILASEWPGIKERLKTVRDI